MTYEREKGREGSQKKAEDTGIVQYGGNNAYQRAAKQLEAGGIKIDHYNRRLSGKVPDIVEVFWVLVAVEDGEPEKSPGSTLSLLEKLLKMDCTVIFDARNTRGKEGGPSNSHQFASMKTWTFTGCVLSVKPAVVAKSAEHVVV